MQTQVIPFEPIHAAMLGADASHFAHLQPLTQGQEALTLWHQQAERPLACAGIITLWPGLGYAWVFVAPDAPFYPQTIARFALRQFRPRLAAFRRVETLIPAGDAVARRFAAWLGFQEVLVKPGYGKQGETYIELAWVREGTNGQ